jgi:hypothetical protein
MKMIVIKVLCFLLIVSGSSVYAQQEASMPDRIPYRKGSKWGYCDRNKKIIIPVSFDAVDFFGATPDDMNLAVPDSLACVKKGKEAYWINKKGKLFPLEAIKLPELEEERMYAETMTEPPRVKLKFTDPQTGKEGLLYGHGVYDTLLPARFEELDFSPYDDSYEIRIRVKGKWGLYKADTQKWLIPAAYDLILPFYELGNQKAFKVKKDGLYGVFLNDKPILPANYQHIELINQQADDLLIVTQVKGMELFDLKGKMLTAQPYDAINGIRFSGKFGPVKKGGKWGLINMQGKLVVPCKYDECNLFLDDKGLCWVKYKGKLGLIDAKGTEYFED